jgi:hypothetical protein
VKHYAWPEFWYHYRQLPRDIQELADKNFVLLKADPWHPSLHFKKVGGLWSVRVGLHYRALGRDRPPDTVVWFWIGRHDEYDRIIDSQ